MLRPSAPTGIIPNEPPGARAKSINAQSADGRPTPADRTTSQGAAMQGRPRSATTRERTAAFIGLLADGVTLYDAILESGISPLRGVRLYCQPDFQVIVDAVKQAGGQMTTIVDTQAA